MPPEEIWCVIISYLAVVDILRLSLCSRFFNSFCPKNKKFQTVKELSNKLSNKDKDIRYFISDFLFDFFYGLREDFQMPNEKLTLTLRAYTCDLLPQLSPFKFFVLYFTAKEVLMLLIVANIARVCL